MQRLGIVDLGSNTARLVVYTYEPGEWFRYAHQIREPVRLGEGLGRKGVLSPKAMERGCSALRLFSEYARSTRLSDVVVLGTSALRDATNRAEFLEQVAPFGHEIFILSGEQEARLGVLAVANGYELEDACVMDLGGGSAQVSWMRQRLFSAGRACPLGAVRLTERFLRADPPKGKEVEALEEAVGSELSDIAKTIRSKSLPLVAMGGTIRNLARAVQRAARYPLGDRLHGYFLEREDLEELTERLLGMKAKRRGRIPGIKSDRADVILAGALVFRWLLRAGKLDGIWISAHGIREGALFQRFLLEPHLIEELRSFSVQNLLSHYAQSRSHIDQVRHLAGQLFKGLRPLHEYGDREAHLLDAGAILQDIGLAVNYYRHDRHGAYLVSSAQLNGFTHREQGLLALLVRYHLKGRPRLGSYRRLCQAGDKRLLLRLAACLRLAEHLDRTRSQNVKDVKVHISDREVRLEIKTRKDPSIELWESGQHRNIFRSAFGLRLVFEPVIASAGC